MDYNYFLASPQPRYLNKRAFNLVEMICLHAVKLLGGRGFTLHGKTEN